MCTKASQQSKLTSRIATPHYTLPIFTVASMVRYPNICPAESNAPQDYLKLIGHFSKDGPPTTFVNVADTEVMPKRMIQP